MGEIMEENVDTGFIIKGAVGFVALIGFFVWLTCFTYISPGTVGVVINLFGDKKGVCDQELNVGMHFLAPWKKVYEFPVFEQNHVWEKDEKFNFQTSEGLGVSADIGITFHLEPTKIHVLFARYRKGMDEISHIFIRNYIRDAVNMISSKMKIEDLYGQSKETFFHQVQAQVQGDLLPMGINIERIYLIGKFIVPDRVVEALNQKIEATQRAQQRENELREAEAQAKKDVAMADGEARKQVVMAESSAKQNLLMAESKAKSIMLEAESQAKANALLTKSLTPELLRSQEIEKWNGQLPTYQGMNAPTPFMSMSK